MRKLYLKRVGPYWYAEQHIEQGGKTIRKTISLKVKGEESRPLALRRLKELERYLTGKEQPHFTPTLYEFAETFLEKVRSDRKKGTYEQYKLNLKVCLPLMQNKQLHRYTPGDIEEVKYEFLGVLKPRTVNNRLMTLSALFAYAVKLEYIQRNPVRVAGTVSVPRINMPEVWTRKELEICLPYLDERIRAAVGLGFYCGLRISEIASLRWDDVHDTHIVVRQSDIQRTKSDRPRTVPTAPPLQEILSDTPHVGRRVVERRPEYIRAKFNEAVIRARLPKITFHGLRHSFATHCAKQGVPIPTLAKLLGHSSIQTTMIYAHVRDTNVHIEW